MDPPEDNDQLELPAEPPEEDLSPQEKYVREVDAIMGESALPFVQDIRNSILKMVALVVNEAWSRGRREAFAEEGIGCYSRHPGEYEYCALSKEHEGPHRAAGLTWE